MHRHRSDFPFTSFAAAAAAASPPVVFRLSAGLVQHASLTRASGCLEQADNAGGHLGGYGGEIGACSIRDGITAPRIPQTHSLPALWARCREVLAVKERLPRKSTQRAKHEMMGAGVDCPAAPVEIDARTRINVVGCLLDKVSCTLTCLHDRLFGGCLKTRETLLSEGKQELKLCGVWC